MRAISILLLSFYFVVNGVAQDININFKLSEQNINLQYHSDNAKIEYEVKKIEEGLEVATIYLRNENGFSPKALTMKWAIASNNIAGYWGSSAY